MLAVGAGRQDRRGAEPVNHRPGKAVLALQRYPLERAVEHAEHLLHIRIDVEIGVFPGTLAGRVGQLVNVLHLVDAVVLKPPLGVGDQIIVAVLPHEHPRADAVELAVVARDHPLLQVPVAVFEGDLLPCRDGGVQRIDGVQNFLVGALDTPADQYLTVQLLLPVCGGELAELVDQDFGFARRDEFAGVDGIDEQLELGKLKRSIGHIVAAAAPALLHDLIFGVGQIV